MFSKFKSIASSAFEKVKQVGKTVAVACGLAIAGAAAVSTPVEAAPFMPVLGALDTAIDTAVTDITGLWDDVKVFVLGVVIFGIAVTFLKKLRRG